MLLNAFAAKHLGDENINFRTLCDTLTKQQLAYINLFVEKETEQGGGRKRGAARKT